MRISQREYDIAKQRKPDEYVIWIELNHNKKLTWRAEDIINMVNDGSITVTQERRMQDRRRPIIGD